ncbi:MAG: hypothetical protein AAF512_03460 [Pseudomonadota bacterium]
MTLIERLIEYSYPHKTQEIGLVMNRELVTEIYNSTPKNCLCFASTGGDGVHFSILKGFEPDDSPVVMTVPMCFDNENMIIAESMKEFLDLGCRYGYFCLEQLCYDFESTVLDIEEHSARDLEYQDLILLSEEFDLSPLSGIGERIKHLNEKYMNSLQIETT